MRACCRPNARLNLPEIDPAEHSKWWQDLAIQHPAQQALTFEPQQEEAHLRQTLWVDRDSMQLAGAVGHSWCSHWPGTSAGTPGRGRLRSPSDSPPGEGTTPTHYTPPPSCTATAHKASSLAGTCPKENVVLSWQHSYGLVLLLA